MSAVKIVDRPELYPGVTPLLRESAGPVAYLGEVITNVHVFLSKRESLQLVLAWGWKTPEQVEELEKNYADLLDKVAVLEEEIGPLRELAKASDKVFRANRPSLKIPA